MSIDICPDYGDIVSELTKENEKLNARIAELSKAVGLITTLKPTMVMDAEHPLEMAKEVAEYVTARIAELEAARRWIPVGERLPDTKIVYDKFDVIVEFENIENGGTTRCVELMSYDYRNKSWNDDCGEYGFYPVAGVTHWRERPTPPEVQE